MDALLDLSHPLQGGMLVGGDLAPPSFQQRQTGHSTADLRILVTEFHLASHVGTHIDAPKHFDPEGSPVDELDLGSFTGEAVLLETETPAATPIDVESLLGSGPTVQPGDILLVKTGWSRYYSVSQEATYREHPYFDAAAVEVLERLGISMLAVDVMSPDAPVSRRTDGFDFPVHQRLLGAGTLIAENLRFGDAAPGNYQVWAFPLSIKGGDGAPVRFIAQRVAER
jgi:kynurenine formamidase